MAECRHHSSNLIRIRMATREEMQASVSALSGIVWPPIAFDDDEGDVVVLGGAG